ncbi:hypothetical protein [Micromonospora endolithica]|uniref:Uncharacterized protein n=1 Tax=Micromonospora endolithica TaxID=230091 RepID=A0A3A9ZSZ6_9ACTN|nr:hypothetical protein [Micromonospora endolithica]RKN50736.1 hypothetical protein D7223_02950 [Micromonospora endolithica]TWJ20522.1 hypothetical protein JD76_00620 [Micromonospora endolithica]
MNPRATGEIVDELREAWLATIAAADRAGAHLHGSGPPGRRLPWQDAVAECWRALGEVYAGLSTAGDGGSAGAVVVGLRAARADADRAAALASRVRRRVNAAEDRLRRTRDATDAARRLAAAADRLDLVDARLAVGGRRIDRSIATLAGGFVQTTAPPERETGDRTATRVTTRTGTTPTGEIARGCRTASRLVARRRGRGRTETTRERRW